MGIFHLSIDRPRRIFRSSNRPAIRSGLTKAVLVVALTAGAGVAVTLAGVGGGSFRADPGGSRVISAGAGQVAVVDGDTLRLGSEVVRLSDILAPARGEACAAGPDCGSRASAALADLVRDRPVECRVSGEDGLGRPAAHCDAGGREVNVALVAIGWARAETGAYTAAETDARAHRRGIWLSN